MTSRLAFEFAKLSAELRANRRLQILLLMIVTIFAGHELANLSDRIDAQRKQLAASRGALSKAQARVRDVEAFARLDAQRARLQRTLDSSLWRVKSPAIAQVQMNEWLNTGLSRLSLGRLTVSQAALVAAKGQSGALPTAPASGAYAADDAAEPQQGQLIEVKATVSFAYDPILLIDALAFLESGQRYAIIDSLTVSPRDHRVEMLVRAVAMLDKAARLPPPDRLTEKDADTSKAPEPVLVKPTPPSAASAPKAVSEVIWQ